MTKHNYLDPTIKVGNDPEFPSGITIAPVSIMSNPHYAIINFEQNKLTYLTPDNGWTAVIFKAKLFYSEEQANSKLKEIQ